MQQRDGKQDNAAEVIGWNLRRCLGKYEMYLTDDYYRTGYSPDHLSSYVSECDELGNTLSRTTLQD